MDALLQDKLLHTVCQCVFMFMCVQVCSLLACYWWQFSCTFCSVRDKLNQIQTGITWSSSVNSLPTHVFSRQSQIPGEYHYEYVGREMECSWVSMEAGRFLPLTQLCCGCSLRAALPLHVWFPGRSGELRLAEAHQSSLGCRHLHRQGQCGGLIPAVCLTITLHISMCGFFLSVHTLCA